MEESNRGRKKGQDDKKDDKKPVKPVEEVPTMASPELMSTLTIVDRMVNQNK